MPAPQLPVQHVPLGVMEGGHSRAEAFPGVFGRCPALRPSSSTGDKPSLWACQGSDQHLAGSLSSDEDMSTALGGAGSVFPPWPHGDDAAHFMYFTWLTGETCPVCPAGYRVLFPPGSRSWQWAPSRGQSRAITRGHPWIEMCLCTGRSLNLLSYQAGLESFERRGMCSGH